MFNNGKKTYAFLLSGVSGNFQREISRSFMEYAAEHDFNLAVFSSFIGFETNQEYLIGESNIINLPPYDMFDGVIVVPDTFRDDGMRETLLEKLCNECTCPVVSIRSSVEGLYNVNVNNETAIEEVIRHMIEFHHMTKIGFVSGTKNHPDAIDRLACYDRVMEEYNLQHDESMICHGNFWEDWGEKYFNHFLSGDRSTWPEAIVCANDYMAIALCNECIKHGINVPDDIAVVGFDNVEKAQMCYPPLTTSGVSVRSFIEKAVSIIERVNKGKRVPKLSLVAPRMVYRNSCGCGDINMRTGLEAINKIRAVYDDIYEGLYKNTYMSVELEKMDEYESIPEYIDVLSNENCRTKDMYICLCEKEYDNNRIVYPVRKGYTDTMKCVLAVKDGQYIETSSFERKNLLPDNAFGDGKAVQCFFSALHFLDTTYGYVAHSYFDNVCHSRAFHNWSVMVGNAMESIRVRKELHASISELNELYIREAMTKLYNRRGFEQYSSAIFSMALRKNKTFALIEMDMDGLKTINDNYGHSAGDEAIEAIAQIFKSVATEREVCSRVGGDEFWIIAYDYNEEQMNDFINRFYSELEVENKKKIREYDLSVSCGGMICAPTEGDTLDGFMNTVDAQMYKDKYSHKARRMN